jgi:DNA-binding IclR family transcriptional regulator
VASDWESKKQVIASRGISEPNFRLAEEQLKIYIHGVLSAAKEISEKLGFCRTLKDSGG